MISLFPLASASDNNYYSEKVMEEE